MKSKKIFKAILTAVLVGFLISCSSQKYYTNSSTPSKDANNYHLKTANKIVDETNSHKGSRERKAERERKHYNKEQKRTAKAEAKQKRKGAKSYKDKKSSGTVPLR